MFENIQNYLHAQVPEMRFDLATEKDLPYMITIVKDWRLAEYERNDSQTNSRNSEQYGN